MVFTKNANGKAITKLITKTKQVQVIEAVSSIELNYKSYSLVANNLIRLIVGAVTATNKNVTRKMKTLL